MHVHVLNMRDCVHVRVCMYLCERECGLVGQGCCCYLVTKLCPTLCDSMSYGPPGSSAHGILQARMLEWVAISLLQGIF